MSTTIQTDSQVLLRALPPLTHLAKQSSQHKNTMFAMLGIWCGSANNTSPIPVSEDDALALLDAAAEHAESPGQEECLSLIRERGVFNFSPAAYLGGLA